MVLDCLWSLPQRNHKPPVEHLTGSLLHTTFHSLTTRVAHKVFPRHLDLQLNLVLYYSLKCCHRSDSHYFLNFRHLFLESPLDSTFQSHGRHGAAAAGAS
jgi:hypothetical protein